MKKYIIYNKLTLKVVHQSDSFSKKVYACKDYFENSLWVVSDNEIVQTLIFPS